MVQWRQDGLRSAQPAPPKQGFQVHFNPRTSPNSHRSGDGVCPFLNLAEREPLLKRHCVISTIRVPENS